MSSDVPSPEYLTSKQVSIYLRFAENESALLRGGREQGPAVERLYQDSGNIQRALRLASEQGDTERFLKLCGALGRYWQIRGGTNAEADPLAAALAGDAMAPPLVRAKAFSSLANLRRSQNRYPEARSYYKESLKLFTREGEREEATWNLFYLGLATTDQGNRVLSRHYYNKCLDLFTELGAERGVAFTLNELAYTASNQGEREAALAYSERSIEIFCRIDEQEGLAWALYNAGQVLSDIGDTELALERTKEALVLFRTMNFENGIAWSYYSMAIQTLNTGDLDRAREDVRGALKIFARVGNHNGRAWALHILGRILFRQGKPALSWKCYRACLRTFLGLGDRTAGIAFTVEGFARIVARGRPDAAAFLFGSAEALRESIRSPLPDADRTDYGRDVERARDNLDERAFAAAWARGRAASPNEAVATIDAM